jgi:hypothetical protein
MAARGIKMIYWVDKERVREITEKFVYIFKQNNGVSHIAEMNWLHDSLIENYQYQTLLYL